MNYLLWGLAVAVLFLSIVMFVPGAMAFANPVLKNQKTVDIWSNRFLNTFFKGLFIYPIFFFVGLFSSLFYDCITIYFLSGYILLLIFFVMMWYILEYLSK